MSKVCETRIEALASSLAMMDGKEQVFWSCKENPRLEEAMGVFKEYTDKAEQLWETAKLRIPLVPVYTAIRQGVGGEYSFDCFKTEEDMKAYKKEYEYLPDAEQVLYYESHEDAELCGVEFEEELKPKKFDIIIELKRAS